MMRSWLGVLLLVPLTLAPLAGAEWGTYDDDGWPVAIDGTSTNPFPPTMGAGDPLNQVAGATIYPYWPLLTAEVIRLARDHPDLVRLTSAGKSTLGLDLHMLEICNFADIASVAPAGARNSCPLPNGSPREVVWVDGGTHSNEYSGVYFALAWAQFLVEQYGKNDTATWIVQNRQTWILPMVNPDGSNVMGRLNANAVNINRNYPVIWDGVGHDALLNNRGPTPASEAETKITIEWYNKTRADYMASVHCCGNLWLYPYGEEGIDPIDEPMLRQICQLAFPEVAKSCGPIWSTIYPASGSSVDTAYEYAGIVSFGYEMSGRGAVGLWGQPITTSAVRTQEFESWNGLEHAFLNVHRYGAYPVVTDVVERGDSLLVTIRNDGWGNMTRAAVESTYSPNAHVQTWRGTELPPLQPGESATVTVAMNQVKLQAAEQPVLAIHYAKRLIASTNIGLAVTPLSFASAGASAPSDGGVLVTQGTSPAEATVPGVPLVFVLAALAAMAIFVRRK